MFLLLLYCCCIGYGAVEDPPIMIFDNTSKSWRVNLKPVLIVIVFSSQLAVARFFIRC